MPGIAWKRFTSSRAIARRKLGRRRAGDDRERDLRADAGDAEQQLEELALLGSREPVQLQRVLADDRVDLDRHLTVAEPMRPTASR